MRLRRTLTALSLAGVAGLGGLAAAAPAGAAPPPSADQRVSTDVSHHHSDFRQFRDRHHDYFLAVCRERFFPHRVFLIRFSSRQQMRFYERFYDLDCRIVRFFPHH